MHTYSNNPQQKAEGGQQSQGKSDADTSSSHASVGSNATALQQLADNSAQVKKGAQLRAIAARNAVPAQRQAVTTGKVVQMMPFHALTMGKWYRVLVDGEVKVLCLSSRRGAFDGKPAMCVFSGKVVDGKVIKKVTFSIENEDNILALSAPPPEPVIKESLDSDEETISYDNDKSIRASSGSEDDSMEEEQDGEKDSSPPEMETIYFSSATATKASQLGVASWNVNHFSNKDFALMMSALRKEFNSFSAEDWDKSFKTLHTRLKEISKETYVTAYRSNKRNFRNNHENNTKFKDKFPRLQNRSESIASISNLVEEFFKLNFDYKTFSAELQGLIGIDWEGKYKSALESTVERPAFTLLVKRLVDFATDLRNAGVVTKVVQDLKNKQRFLSKFDDLDELMIQDLFDALTTINSNLMNVSNLEEMLSALHTNNIQQHVNEMFQRNSDWLDVVALHEVNDPEKLKDSPEYDMHVGPHLISGQGKGQNEYYPLLIKKGAHIEVKQIYLVTTDGTMKPTENGKQESWNKNFKKQADKVFRPIVVYEMEKTGNKGKKQVYWLGIVHTTPESDTGISEFNREKIYDEVEEGLKTLKSEADKRKIPLVIGGDYYLTAEAVTRDMNREEREDYNENTEEREDFGRTFNSIAKLQGILFKKQMVLQKKLMELEKKKKQPEAADVAEVEYLEERLKFLEEAKRNNQILRNIYGLTVAARIEDLGLYLAQPVTGTNPKKKPLLRWFDLQIADFFVHDKGIQSAEVGIMRPQGQIAKVDTEDMYNSRYWQHFSDHFPVGGIFSTKNKDLSRHRALAGMHTAKARELANISNIRRFARLQLIDTQRKPDLTLEGLDNDTIEELALRYLHGYMKLHYNNHEEPHNVEECIIVIRELEHMTEASEDERLFVTSSGDFEPDTAAMAAVPAPAPAKNRIGPKEKKEIEMDTSQRFLLNQQQELQQGWNCGDLAIGLSRDELVQWLLSHEDEEVVRELLAPEIKTAAATSLVHEEEEKEKKKDSKLQEEKLKTWFTLLDEAQEDEIRQEALIGIHSALKDKESSGNSANRNGLPEGMLTEQLKTLLNNYYNAHEAMKDIVAEVNNAFGFTVMKDAMQLDAYIMADFEVRMQKLEDLGLYEPFNDQLDLLKDREQRLNKYLTRKDVFRKYVTDYYGNHGWMVYHLDFKSEEEDAHTSVIDLAAKFKNTMVRIWIKQEGVFKLHRSTDQYGTGVVNVLYNGYNHFIGLNDNPGFVEEKVVKKSASEKMEGVEQPAPEKKEEVMQEEKPVSQQNEEMMEEVIQ